VRIFFLLELLSEQTRLRESATILKRMHGKCQGRECRADILVVEGRVVEIQFSPETGKPPLSHTEMRHFEELVRAKAREIVDKWIDFFVLNKSIKPERITRKIKS
jgi:hypothetical protein